MYQLAVLLDSSVTGGAERVVRSVIGGLPDDRMVTLIGTTEQVLSEVAEGRPGCECILVDGTLWSWLSAIRSSRATVVHANLSSFTNCRAGIGAALLLRRRVVVVDHLPAPGLGMLGRVLQRLMTALLARRLAVSGTSATDVERWGGLHAGTVGHIDNGVPVPGQRAGVMRAGRAHTLGFLGRLESVKGVDVLLRAMQQLPGVTLLIAGQGSRESELRRLAHDLGVADRVEFLGWVDGRGFLGRIDVLVQPSREEAMPLTILEAMLNGVPVVATDVGAVAEVLADDTGIVVPAGDPDRLARACAVLVESGEERRRLARRAELRATTRYSAQRMAADYDLLYRQSAPAG